MITTEDIKEFVELMSSAIFTHNNLKNNDFSSVKVEEAVSQAYDKVCEQLINNQVVKEGRIIEGVFPFNDKNKTK